MADASNTGALDWFKAGSSLFAARSATQQQPQGVNLSHSDQNSLFNSSGWTVATSGSTSSGSINSWLLFMSGALIAYFVGKH